MLAGAVGACSSSSAPTTAERCRELEPQVSAEQAWDDIYELQQVVAEYKELDCESVLAPD